MTFFPGHSGAPVFLDGNGTVVAMVAMIDDSRRDVALLIPTNLIRRAWPTFGEPSAEHSGAETAYRGLKILSRGTPRAVQRARQLCHQDPPEARRAAFRRNRRCVGQRQIFAGACRRPACAH